MGVKGHCEDRFSGVREAFEKNFQERGEVGAAVCVMFDGAPVVNLWGGVKDLDSDQPWEEDSMVVVMSCTKGAVALCGHILMDRGQLDPEAPVARYWPEFAAHGKGDISVRQVFSHQSGVAHVKPAVPPDGFSDWETIIRLIERSSPFWKPGTRTGYHLLTHGYLIGELVRRISGQSVGQFFREEVAKPLGLDFWIGLPDSEHHRVVPLMPAPLPDLSPMMKAAMKLPPKMLREIVRLLAPGDMQGRAMTNLGGFLDHFDTPEYYRAEIPSAGGITNARSLAGMYAPLSIGGWQGDKQIVRSEAIAAMRYPQSVTDHDVFLGGRSSFTLGFSKSWANNDADGLNSVIIGEDAFGTPGFGGHIGFADPYHRLSFGYTMNRQGQGTGLNERGQTLVDEVYRALGCRENTRGFWARPC